MVRVSIEVWDEGITRILESARVERPQVCVPMWRTREIPGGGDCVVIASGQWVTRVLAERKSALGQGWAVRGARILRQERIHRAGRRGFLETKLLTIDRFRGFSARTEEMSGSNAGSFGSLFQGLRCWYGYGKHGLACHVGRKCGPVVGIWSCLSEQRARSSHAVFVQ